MEPRRPSLHVLLVDDSIDDVTLITLTLAKGVELVEWTRVATRAELEQALERDWDVILVDWSMPGWGGAEALQVLALEERRPPVIVVSGDLPPAPEIARAMGLGVAAFLDKRELGELVEVIDQVLLEAGGSLLERTAGYLLAYPELATSILDAVPVAILAVSARGGTIRFASSEAQRLTGYLRSALVGAPIEVLVPNAVRERHASTLRPGFFDNPMERRVNGALRRRDGTEIPVSITLRPTMTREGVLTIVVLRPDADR